MRWSEGGWGRKRRWRIVERRDGIRRERRGGRDMIERSRPEKREVRFSLERGNERGKVKRTISSNSSAPANSSSTSSISAFKFLIVNSCCSFNVWNL